MLRKFIYNKFFRTSAMLLLLVMLLLFPVNKEYTLDDVSTKYVFLGTKTSVYLLDRYNYVAETKINITKENTVSYARKLMELLIIDGKYESKIPTGFKPVLPSNISVDEVKIDKDKIYVDVSKEFYELKKEDEERALELIIYNLTTIDNIKYVYISVEGKSLDVLPKSNIPITEPLTRLYGVNKIYDETDYKNTSKTTVYFISKTNKEYYYVPVTKINNDNRDKIEIILDELTSSNTYQSNLMSFLNYNTKLSNYNIVDDVLTLNFNKYIFDDVNSKQILEEVVYTICLSIKDNYDVKEVVFNVDNKEIIKSKLKDIE